MECDKMGHRCFFGKTSTGKTTLAKYIFWNESGKGIFYNTQLERVKGDVVKPAIQFQPHDIIDYDKIVLTPSVSIPQQERELNFIQSVLFRIGQQLQDARANPFINLYVDEAHIYSGKQSPDDPLQKIARQGLGHGVILNAISQRPADLNHTIITQSDVFYLFNVNDWELPYFDRYGIPVTDNLDWLRRPYHFIKYTSNGDTVLYRPIQP